MSRARVGIALLALGLAAVVVLATGTLEKGKAPSPSPRCLPSSSSHSAKLQGLALYASPAPQTAMANPHTQISFIGIPAGEIQQVSAVGTHSGPHAGRLRGYSQGDGASFLPDRPFAAGERVSVRALVGPRNHGRRIGFSFGVDTPYPTSSVTDFPNPPAAGADVQSFATVPAMQAPSLTVSTADRDPGAGAILMTNGPGPGPYGPLIYTPQGRLVWFRQLSGGMSAENLSVQTYEGRRDLTFWQGRVLSLGFGQGEDLVLDSHYQTVARIAGGNGLQADLHDFQIVPGNDVAYTTAYNPIRCDLSSVGGVRDGAIVDAVVQEIDMRTGLVRWEWHSLDHVGVGESETGAPANTTPWDWFHLNSVDSEPDGNLFVSARSTWAGYQVQAGTGDVLWRLGGSKSSFQMGPNTKTAWQHDGRILADGEVTLFDNGSNPPVHHQSRALRIGLDMITHRATLRAQYTHPSPLLSVSQGNVQTLPDGNTVVGYGAIPQISEYAKDGSLLFDAHLPLQMNSYRAFRAPWSGLPSTPPAVLANLNNTGEETIVRMSWNGATGVARWRVLAGEHPQDLTPQTTVPASGFESSASLPQKHVYVAVQALDAAGHVLRASSPAHVASYASAFPAKAALEPVATGSQ